MFVLSFTALVLKVFDQYHIYAFQEKLIKDKKLWSVALHKASISNLLGSESAYFVIQPGKYNRCPKYCTINSLHALQNRRLSEWVRHCECASLELVNLYLQATLHVNSVTFFHLSFNEKKSLSANTTGFCLWSNNEPSQQWKMKTK